MAFKNVSLWMPIKSYFLHWGPLHITHRHTCTYTRHRHKYTQYHPGLAIHVIILNLNMWTIRHLINYDLKTWLKALSVQVDIIDWDFTKLAWLDPAFDDTSMCILLSPLRRHRFLVTLLSNFLSGGSRHRYSCQLWELSQGSMLRVSASKCMFISSFQCRISSLNSIGQSLQRLCCYLFRK